MKPSLKALTELSNRYGYGNQYTIGSSGNTSYKENGILYVKPSGTQLATLQENEFISLEISTVLSILQNEYSQEDILRERQTCDDMYAAVLPENGDTGIYPSIESVMHAMFPQRYVMHLHPVLANALNCSPNGAQTCKDLFGDWVLWIPFATPGYSLAQTCFSSLSEYKSETGRDANFLIMEHHGMLVAADTTDEINRMMTEITKKLQSCIVRIPDLDAIPSKEDASLTAATLHNLYERHVGSCFIEHIANSEALLRAKNAESASILRFPLTLDHIMQYHGSILYIEKGANLISSFDAFVEENGYAPKIVLVQDLGFYALGASKKDAVFSSEVFLNALSIVAYAESFGGSTPLPEDAIELILNRIMSTT